MRYTIETHNVNSPNRSYTLHVYEKEGEDIVTSTGRDYTVLKLWVGRNYPEAKQKGLSR